jgi:hypothetical protein
MTKTISILVGVLAAGLIAAGCGSSDKSGEKSSITKAEFVKKGNAICAQGNKEIETQGQKVFGKDPNKKPSKAKLEEFANTVLLPSVEDQVNKIRALGAPKGDEAKVKAILDAADQGIQKGKQDPLSLTNEGSDPFADANRLAKAYGLKVCGSG